MIPDAVINMVLMGAFGIYCLMGLIFFIMGLVYMGDAGAIGATGLYLIFLGLVMLIVGGIALWANANASWMILFIIELINVALFLFLYILIVIVLMMATGTTDPVREATVETWELTKPTLTIPGSDPDGDPVGSYCQHQTEGSACTMYYAQAIITDTCQMGPGYGRMELLNNCTKANDPTPLMGEGDNTGCSDLYNLCTQCDTACMEAQIQEVKDNLEPASLFVLLMIVYLTITIVWNNVMVANDDLEGVPQMVGFVLNGILLALSFVLMVMGGVGAWKADDACPSAADGCIPTSMVLLTLIGAGLLVISGIVLVGVQTGNGMLIQVMTIVMIFMAIFMVLFGLLLGMSTGVVMDDMTYYYDTQYPKLRSALEKANNEYCQMSKEQCINIVTAASSPLDTTNTVTVQTEDYSEDVTDDDGNVVVMPFADMWKAMHAEAALEAAALDDSGASTAPAWLAPCATTGICIYCQDLLDPMENDPLYVWDNTADSSLIGTPCTDATDASCVERAPNFNWDWGLIGAVNNTDTAGDSDWADAAHEGLQDISYGGDFQTSTLDGVEYFTATSYICQGTEALDTEYATSWEDSDDVDENPDCLAPFSTDEDADDAQEALYAFKRCAGASGKQMEDAWDNSVTPFGENPCDYTGFANQQDLYIEPVDSWTSKVNNYTRFNDPARVAMPYCEEAIADYVVVDQNCRDYDELEHRYEKSSYYANCDNCDNPLAPFLFSMPGPESGYRQCLNFVVGHVQDFCTPNAASDCLSAIQASASNIQFMVDTAFNDNSGFCGYSDEGCKAKIKYDLEDSMLVIGILGAVFLFFFLAVIYCTYAAIQSYQGGDDDDDDDDE